MEILDCILGFSLLFPSPGNTLKQWTVLSGTPWRKNLTVVRVQDSNASLIYLSISGREDSGPALGAGETTSKRLCRKVQGGRWSALLSKLWQTKAA